MREIASILGRAVYCSGFRVFCSTTVRNFSMFVCTCGLLQTSGLSFGARRPGDSLILLKDACRCRGSIQRRLILLHHRGTIRIQSHGGKHRHSRCRHMERCHLPL